HSWNSTYQFSNWYLFNLQRHADHHAWASRPYHQLRAFSDAPQLPLGYPTMILLSLVPPAWFAVMNPRVEQARAEARAA
ncbi:MAG: fatty acid desaturase, partial [Myxococcota bacterium]